LAHALHAAAAEKVIARRACTHGDKAAAVGLWPRQRAWMQQQQGACDREDGTRDSCTPVRLSDAWRFFL